MATPFDTGLIASFSIIFPFLLTFAIVYGVLSATKTFDNNRGIQGIIAIVCAFSILMSSLIREVMNTMAPWFVLLFFFTVFTLASFKIFGATDNDIIGVLKSPDYRSINYFIMAVILIIGFGSLFKVLSDRGGIGSGNEINVTAPDGTVTVQNQESEFWNTIINTKVLGLIIIFLIATVTVNRLAGY